MQEKHHLSNNLVEIHQIPSASRSSALLVLLFLRPPVLLGRAGRPAFIPLDDSTFDSVNLQNLNVLVHAPIYNKAGAIPLSIVWSGNSYCSGATGTWQCVAQSTSATNFGAIAANGFLGGPTGVGWATAYPLVLSHGQCPDRTTQYTYSQWVVREANGTLHPLPVT